MLGTLTIMTRALFEEVLMKASAETFFGEISAFETGQNHARHAPHAGSVRLRCYAPTGPGFPKGTF